MVCAPVPQDYAQLGCSEDAYLARHYIGHYSPAGNFFVASALLGPLLSWLGDASPPAYEAVGRRDLVANL